MNAIFKGAVAALSVGAVYSTAAMAQDNADLETINFGIISTESQMNLRDKWEPFLADMEEKTGYTVKPFFASDYAGIIEGMRFDKVDAAWYGNKSAMEAVDRADGQIFAQTVDISGNPGYWSVVIVPADSELSSIDDLLQCNQDIDFGLGDPNSTSGYLVPMTFIFAENDVQPQDCFANVTNANHETNAMAVANGQVDAAANNTESMGLIEANHPDAYANIKEIWRSPLIPSDPIVWRGDLPQAAQDALKDFFLTYGTEESENTEEEKQVLAGLEWAPFRASSNDQLLPIRVMEATRQIAAIEADDSMSEEEKQSQIAELEEARSGYQEKMQAQEAGAPEGSEGVGEAAGEESAQSQGGDGSQG